MGGLGAALNAGKTSLLTNQKAIEITGLNVANVNTPGYSRQTPNLTPYPSLNFGDFFTGTGVTIGSIERSHDVFLSGQINEKNVASGFENAMLNPLAEVERVIGIGDGSISDEFDRFFDSIRELSTNPSGEVERQLVLQRGGLIGDTFRNTYDELQQVAGNINDSLTSKIDGINMRTAEIADLNKRISGLEMSGQDANSDRDRRDMLVKELSGLIGSKSFETSNGNVSIQLPNGMPLVEADQFTAVESYVSGVDVQLRLKFGSTDIDLDRNALGGEIGGLYEVRDVLIPDVVNRLDQLAYAFATEVNAQHQAGQDLNGNPGQAFFVAPAAHVSQGYANPVAANFGTGDIQLNVNGVSTAVTIDATNNSLNGMVSAINLSGANVTASVDPTDNSLVITPNVAGNNVLIDTSALSGGSYARPTFSSAGMASSLSMNIGATAEIAAGTSSAPGDNTNALALLSAEQGQTVGADTFVSFYGKIAAAVGVETSRNRQASQGLEDSLVQLNNLRDGIDGVSLEDEMINLLKYQRGFEASAKFLSTVDEMMATLLTLKR